jgi:hypothetical protein
MWRNSFAYYEDEDGNYRDIFTDEIAIKNNPSQGQVTNP